ncbi:KICSTOR complex protein kaptin [Entomortierella parvispora]|uniref:KICSTOR complex protein kaptin n=1 Tax=Entomortierella parvispora TaxID=205924 RepID=A0A9P3HE75_9FUNG|nr:KICSTOR complex protein kaptin [Entomortierella parvispora]
MDHHSHYRDQDHRPPVLFQSDDLDQDHDIAHPLHRSHSSSRPSHHPSARHHSHSSTHDRLRHDGSAAYPSEDERPVHVHSQECHDSCPVQDIYTETSFSRFSGGARTNLYGLVVVKELGTPSTYPSPDPVPTENLFAIDSLVDASTLVEASSSTAEKNPSRTQNLSTAPVLQAEENSENKVDQDNGAADKSIPAVAGSAPESTLELKSGNVTSTKSSIFTPSGSSTWAHLPGRYVLVAAGSSIKCIMGLQESFEFTVHDLDKRGGGTGSANQEIVSIDAFERIDERGCQLILLVSIAKAVDPAQFELRCYGAKTFGNSIKELLLKLPISKDVQTIPLSWAPTKIIHAPLEDDPFEMAILVGGSDSCVHFFVQDSDNGIYEEQPIETHFSVLASFSYCEYCVLSLEIKDYPHCRVVAAGTQNGTLNIGIIPRDPTTFQLDRSKAKSHTIVLFAPITTLTVFTSRVQADHKSYSQGDQSEAQAKVVEQKEEAGIHLLVTCAIEQAWIYSNINKYGLANRSDLSECSYHDSIMTAHVMDADWDGQNEIMIGTYGRQLMVFKELPQSQVQANSGAIHNGAYSRPTSITAAGTKISISPASFPPHPQPISYNHSTTASMSMPAPPPPPALQWGMTWNRRFASPVYGISSVDLNDDGLEELVITTSNGCSIFLPDPLTAKRRLGQAVDRMRAIDDMKATLARLRQENAELLKEKEEKEAREAQEIQAAKEAKEAREAALQKAEKEEEEREEKRWAAALEAEKKAREEEEKERARKEDEFRIEREALAKDQHKKEKLAGEQDEQERAGEQQAAESVDEYNNENQEPDRTTSNASNVAASSEDPDLTIADTGAEMKTESEGENAPQDPDQGDRGETDQEQSDKKVLETAESMNANPAVEENEGNGKGEDADKGQLKEEGTEEPDLEGLSKLRRSNESEFDKSPELSPMVETRLEQDKEEKDPTLP